MQNYILFFMLFIGITLYSQEYETISKKELKRMAKEDKKAKRLEEEEMMKELTALMLHSHRFVLEADYIGDGRGQRIPVNSNINFVAIDSLEGVIQYGSPHGIGYNGVGGVTADGRISKYELKEVSRKSRKLYTLQITIMTGLGTYDIAFSVSETGYADATVSGYTRGQLKYSGRLVPVKVSKVYKASTVF